MKTRVLAIDVSALARSVRRSSSSSPTRKRGRTLAMLDSTLWIRRWSLSALTNGHSPLNIAKMPWRRSSRASPIDNVIFFWLQPHVARVHGASVLKKIQLE